MDVVYGQSSKYENRTDGKNIKNTIPGIKYKSILPINVKRTGI